MALSTHPNPDFPITDFVGAGTLRYPNRETRGSPTAGCLLRRVQRKNSCYVCATYGITEGKRKGSRFQSKKKGRSDDLPERPFLCLSSVAVSSSGVHHIEDSSGIRNLIALHQRFRPLPTSSSRDVLDRESLPRRRPLSSKRMPSAAFHVGQTGQRLGLPQPLLDHVIAERPVGVRRCLEYPSPTDAWTRCAPFI